MLLAPGDIAHRSSKINPRLQKSNLKVIKNMMDHRVKKNMNQKSMILLNHQKWPKLRLKTNLVSLFEKNVN